MYERNSTIWLPSCHSTNTYAKEWLKEHKVISGWTVSTFHQTAGRGQMGNSWESEPYSNLTFSTVHVFEFLNVSKLFYLNMAVSLAVIDFLHQQDIEGTIKWPNDIYVNSFKIGGLLIEPNLYAKMVKHAVIGIGLNVNQKNFKVKGATSMCLLKNKDYQPEVLLEKLLIEIEEKMEYLKSGLFSLLKEHYYQRLYLIDRPASFSAFGDAFTGIIRGVDDAGRLLIESEDKILIFNNKEVLFNQLA